MLQEFTFDVREGAAPRKPTDRPPSGPSLPARPAGGHHPKEESPEVKTQVQVIPVRRPMQTRRAWASDEFLRRERELDAIVGSAIVGLSRIALPPSDAARLQDAVRNAVDRWRRDPQDRL